MRQLSGFACLLICVLPIPITGQEPEGEASGARQRSPEGRQAARAITRETTDYDVERLLEQDDTNRDGKIGEGDQRIRPLLARSFATFDTNSDGYLDAEELKKTNFRPFGGRLFLEAFDKDADGELTKDEAVHPALARRFEDLDADGSGTLNKAEMDAMRGGIRFGGGRPRAQRGNSISQETTDYDVERLLEWHDSNKDGKIAKDEEGLHPAVVRIFDQTDTNADGYLDRAELKRSGIRPFSGRLFLEAFDRNLDGVLSKAEATGPLLTRDFEKLDEDGSGTLSEAEMDAMRGAFRFGGSGSGGGQRNDPDFKPSVTSPRFTSANAPTVAIDEGHRNFHTKDGRFLPFAQVVEADGCNVVGHAGAFTKQSLESIDVLVIANALPVSRGGQEIDSAFGEDEIAVLKDWVHDGGSLMVLADHRPYGEASMKLGAAFGVEMSGGFVLDNDEQRGRIEFGRENKLLASHPITDGATSDERVTSVTSFTGQALRVPENFTPLMSLAEGTVRYPDRGSVRGTDGTDVSDWHQGAVAEFGQGRIAFFGEAGMFSAQVAGPGLKFGMNAAGAEQNQQFLLNIVRWLATD